jgi:long-chain acyl-CoA synthetase
MAFDPMAELEKPFGDYSGLISAWGRERPDRVALDDGTESLTWSEVAALVERIAAQLQRDGLQKGQSVAILGTSTVRYALAYLGAIRAGGCAAPLTTSATPQQLGAMLKDSGAMHLFIDAPKLADLAGRDLPAVKTIMLDAPLDGKADIFGWMAEEGTEAAPHGCGPKDPFNIIYSSGTTGTPKGIMLSNYNFVSEGLMCANWTGMNPDYSDILAMLPIFHGFGLGVCVNSALSNGGKSILVPMFDADLAAKMIKKKPNFLIGVPTLFDALTKSEKFNKSDLSCLYACFSGADTLPRVVKERFESIVTRQGGKGVKLLEGYGLTEAVTAIMAMPIGEYREGSIGIPFPNMLAKIVKKGTTEEAPVGEEGEICLHGPAVMMGYLDQPEETAEALRMHPDGLVWLHTGDIATMDQDGFFYFKLREKRMIKSSGMNVYPAQVEGHLYKHEAVADCCVIGIPDKEQVERVKAFVVLKKEFAAKAGPDMTKELIEHCRKDLIKWSCPREVEFINELPKTRVGKIAYTELQKREIDRLRAEGKYCGEKTSENK